MSASLPPLLPDATASAEFASTLVYEDISPGVVDRIELCLLDGIGVCLHGSTLPWSRMVQELVLGEGGTPVASLFQGTTRGLLDPEDQHRIREAVSRLKAAEDLRDLCGIVGKPLRAASGRPGSPHCPRESVPAEN